MREVFLAGISMTPFGVHVDKSIGDLARQATRDALADAGASDDLVEAIYYANTAQGSIEGQHALRGQHGLRPMGFDGCPIFNVEAACAGSAVAFHMAVMHVGEGRGDVALAVGSEKLITDDRAKKLAVFGQPMDLAAVTEFVEARAPEVEDVRPPAGVDVGGGARSIFMDAYATLAKLHMKRYGTTWAQIARVSEKNHRHSTMNPLAQFRHAIGLEEILGARIVSWPLTLPMCAPVSDGAAAAVVCSRDGLQRFARVGVPLRVLGCAVAGGGRKPVGEPGTAALHRAAKAAYAQAKIAPAEVSVAEVHDASAYAEINQIEMIGLCEFGQGGPFTESGATTLGGRVPVNTSGGLQSKGHPIAATGIGQIHELALQLRAAAGARQVEGAKIGAASCGGGFLGGEEAMAVMTLIGKD